jgi:hypothetical protein
MKSNYFLSLSIIIIIIISFILIIYFYYNKKKEKFRNILNDYEVLLPGWDVNKNANPKTNPTLTQFNHFTTIPDDLITWTPYTINKYGQQNYNAYFYNNNYMYPLY